MPYQAVKDVLSQADGIGVRGNWISLIQEYDLEIKPIKIVKGQGLAQLLTKKGNNHAINLVEEQESHILRIDENHEWYKDIVYFLRNLSCLDHLVDHQRRALRLNVEKYTLTQDGLGWRNPDGIILKCVNEEESKTIIKEIQAGMCSGHYAPKTTTVKIMRAR